MDQAANGFLEIAKDPFETYPGDTDFDPPRFPQCVAERTRHPSRVKRLLATILILLRI